MLEPQTILKVQWAIKKRNAQPSGWLYKIPILRRHAAGNLNYTPAKMTLTNLQGQSHGTNLHFLFLLDLFVFKSQIIKRKFVCNL